MGATTDRTRPIVAPANARTDDTLGKPQTINISQQPNTTETPNSFVSSQPMILKSAHTTAQVVSNPNSALTENCTFALD